MSPWLLLRFVKFLGVAGYCAGVGVGLSTAEPDVRKRTVHLLASPALLVTWIAGYLLTFLRGTSVRESWIVGGFLSSVACHLLLIHAARTKSLSVGRRAGVLLALTLTLWLMVFRPILWSV